MFLGQRILASPSFRPALALLLILHCCTWGLLAHAAGPVYSLGSIHPEGEQLHLTLQKYSQNFNFFSQDAEHQYPVEHYVSTIDLGAEKPLLSPTRRLLVDDKTQDTEFIKIAGSDDYLAITDDERKERRDISLLKLAPDGSYASTQIL